MKTKLTFFLLLFTSSLQLMFSQTWEYSNALESEWMRKICTQGLDTVYIVGRNGLIARSTDRSATWTKQYPITAQLNDIIFCNHTTGFAVGNNGTILKTADSGDAWTQISSGTTQNLNAIAAASIDNIWAVGDNGTVFYSHDSGSTWQVKDLSLTAQLNDISFRNSTGYIVGNNSTCYKTTDAGDYWNNLELTGGDNLIVQQTENGHLYVLYGGYPFGHHFIVDENREFAEKTLTSFVMANDSIGYGMMADGTTGASGSLIQISVYKYGNYLGYGFDSNNNTDFDVSHSDVLVINDSTGYALTGSQLYRINNKNIIQGINKPQINNDLLLKQDNNHLKVIPTNSKRITDVKITSLSGAIISKQKGDEVNIATVPPGLYIVKIIFDNKSFAVKKWIKY